MNRRARLLLAAAGGVTSVLLGSGLLALTSDSVTSPANVFESGPLTPPPTPTAHEVRGGLLTSAAASCDATTPGLFDGPISAALQGPVLDLDGGSILQFTEYCIRNDGTSDGRLRVAVVNVVGTELGPCEAAETAAGDTTCGAGAAGELATAVTWSFLRSFHPHTSTSCTSSTPSIFSGTTSVVIDSGLAPGETCRVRLGVQVPASTTDDQRLRAQTDQVGFDIVFTLEDPTVP